MLWYSIVNSVLYFCDSSNHDSHTELDWYLPDAQTSQRAGTLRFVIRSSGAVGGKQAIQYRKIFGGGKVECVK